MLHIFFQSLTEYHIYALRTYKNINNNFFIERIVTVEPCQLTISYTISCTMGKI